MIHLLLSLLSSHEESGMVICNPFVQANRRTKSE